MEQHWKSIGAAVEQRLLLVVVRMQFQCCSNAALSLLCAVRPPAGHTRRPPDPPRQAAWRVGCRPAGHPTKAVPRCGGAGTLAFKRGVPGFSPPAPAPPGLRRRPSVGRGKIFIGLAAGEVEVRGCWRVRGEKRACGEEKEGKEVWRGVETG